MGHKNNLYPGVEIKISTGDSQFMTYETFVEKFNKNKEIHKKFANLAEENYPYPVNRDDFLLAVQSIPEQEFEQFRSAVARQFPAYFNKPSSPAADFAAATHPPLPAVAPELYADRANRKESAPDFIQRVYAPWLDGRLSRVGLRALDSKAWAALNNWEQHAGLKAPFNLPSKWIRGATPAPNPEILRAARRIVMRGRRL